MTIKIGKHIRKDRMTLNAVINLFSDVLKRIPSYDNFTLNSYEDFEDHVNGMVMCYFRERVENLEDNVRDLLENHFRRVDVSVLKFEFESDNIWTYRIKFKCVYNKSESKNKMRFISR